MSGALPEDLCMFHIVGSDMCSATINRKRCCVTVVTLSVFYWQRNMCVNSIKGKRCCLSTVTLTRQSVMLYVPWRSIWRWIFTFKVWPFYSRAKKSSGYRMLFCNLKVESNVTSKGLFPVQWQTNSIHRSVLIFHWRNSGIWGWAF